MTGKELYEKMAELSDSGFDSFEDSGPENNEDWDRLATWLGEHYEEKK